MTDEQKHLCALIDQHCAAMKAQVVDERVKLEFMDGSGKWIAADNWFLTYNEHGATAKRWARLAPVPRLIPLDQSDFVGVNRVTHLRRVSVPRRICAVTQIHDDQVTSDGLPWLTFGGMDGWECSRDNGATWGPCSKPEASK